MRSRSKRGGRDVRLFPLVRVGAIELLIDAVELPIAFIGDWGGLDGFERAVPVLRDGTHETEWGTQRDRDAGRTEKGEQIRDD